MVTKILADHKINCDHLLGQFLDEEHYDTLIDSDTDFLVKGSTLSDDIEVGFIFRKNFFSKEEQYGAYIGLREAATASQNRGLAAGPKTGKLNNRLWVTQRELDVIDYCIKPANSLFDTETLEDVIANSFDNINPDVRGRVWLKAKVEEEYPEYHSWFERWCKKLLKLTKEDRKAEAEKVLTWISTTTYAMPSMSGIAGYFDRYPRINWGRATSYTRDNPEKFAKAFPFLRTLNDGYKNLLPNKWNNQKAFTDRIDPRFVISDTVFTTITVNKSFRTAAHRDAGDFQEGFSNLLVVSDGDYSGGYLVLPEYRVAINIRPGDLLLINNHDIIHGNTEIKLDNDKAERLSLVCYVRQMMGALGSFDYENARYEFAERRRKNKEHPQWRPMWNGLSEQCYSSEEFHNFLLDNYKEGKNWLLEYHPEYGKNINSLEAFF